MGNTTYNIEQAVNIASFNNLSTDRLSRMYGVGISQAMLEQASQNFRQFGKNAIYNTAIGSLVSRSPQYSPDAYPDGKGGYVPNQNWDGYMSSSLIGMPVMCYCKFVGGTYTDIRGNSVTIPDIIFETVVMTVRMGKSIAKTDMLSPSNGTVKEFIGQGDWQVEIRAIITSDAPVNSNVTRVHQDGVYPRSNMAEIYKLLKAPIAVPVQCWYLNQVDINYLVIEDGAQFEQIEGEYSTQRLYLPCVSDNPLIIKLNT